MLTAIYPGSFDPVTMGHMDIIERAARVVDKLVIGVLGNSSKSPLFTPEERVELLREAVKDYSNVIVESFDGLTVDFARKHGAKIIVRGLRVVTDFESEMQMAQTNHYIDPEIDTMFFTTSLEYHFLSSTIVKEMVRFGRDVNGLVPACVAEALKQKHLK